MPLLACGGARDETDLVPTSQTSITMSGGDSFDTGSDSASSEAGIDDGEEIFDVGNGMGSGADDGGNQQGCDKVDFLFIIDNSGSMADEQINLISSFPQFITTIQNTLDEAQDYHIMVIDTDAWVFAQCPFLCDSLFGSCFINPQFECGVTQPLECEDVLGAGVVHPRGTDASNKDCNFSTGARYMDTTEPDLHAAFACAAKVGSGSTEDPERPMEAMVQAVTPGTPAWDCNQGFLRDDAILVVTFITDEDDNPGDGSAGTVEGWKQALVSAKHGDEKAIVMLGLFGDNDQPNAICPPLSDNAGAEPSPRLRQFVESFGDRGIAGSVCAPSYQEFFQMAVDVIDTTCEEYIPPVG